jgi:hypothetical protein
MKPIVGLLMACLFLDKSFHFVMSKKHSFTELMGKTASLTFRETFRHLLGKKTNEETKEWSFFFEPHQ